METEEREREKETNCGRGSFASKCPWTGKSLASPLPKTSVDEVLHREQNLRDKEREEEVDEEGEKNVAPLVAEMLAPFEEPQDEANKFASTALYESDQHVIDTSLQRLLTLLRQHAHVDTATKTVEWKGDLVVEGIQEPVSSYLGPSRVVLNNATDLLLGNNSFFVVGFIGFKSAPVLSIFDSKLQREGEEEGSEHYQKYKGVYTGICAVDDELIAMLPKHDGILTYITSRRTLHSTLNERSFYATQHADTHEPDDLRLADFMNVVVLRDAAAVNTWFHSSSHLCAAHHLSPFYYSHIRLHNGTWSLASPFAEQQQNSHQLATPAVFNTLYPFVPPTLRSTKYIRFDAYAGKMKFRAVRFRQLEDYDSHGLKPENLPPFVFRSFMSASAAPFFEQVVNYLQAMTGVKSLLLGAKSDAPCQSPAEALASEEGCACAFMCGLSYTRGGGDNVMHLLAAPALTAERYQLPKPVYYSDVIVRQDSPYTSLSELIVALKTSEPPVFILNEDVSFSGYTLPLKEFRKLLGDNSWSFTKTRASGSHLRSIDAVLDDPTAFAAIDSTVLDAQKALRPEVASLRILGSLGPNAMPPVVALKSEISEQQADLMRAALLSMHTYTKGQAILHSNGYRAFLAVSPQDYASFV